MKRENTIAILVKNKPDVLARIAGTFSGRGFNIESISANVTMDPTVTKIVITTIGNKDTVTKLEKQLDKIVDVFSVKDLTDVASAQREMILIRMKVPEADQDRFKQTVDINRWKIISMDMDTCILEITGDRKEINNALAILKSMAGPDDFTRTGIVALEQK
jgi:acetolactate synthase I/III small subunit